MSFATCFVRAIGRAVSVERGGNGDDAVWSW